MKLFIEKVVNEAGEPHGELYIESDADEFKVVHYSEKVGKTSGKHGTLSTHHYLTFGGCLRNIKRRKIKESTAADVKAMLKRFDEIETYIRTIQPK